MFSWKLFSGWMRFAKLVYETIRGCSLYQRMITWQCAVRLFSRTATLSFGKTELFSLEWIHCCIRLALLFVNITDGKKGFPSANKDEKKCDFDGILFEPNIREENVNEKPLFRFRFLYFVTIQL